MLYLTIYMSNEAEIYMVYNRPINEQLCSFKVCLEIATKVMKNGL